MREKQHLPHSPELNLGDIYYVLFRRKWLIAIISTLGLAAAIYTWMTWPYQSDATLFIKYVLETRTPGEMEGDSKIKTPDDRGENIINSEVSILTSFDLAQQVADIIGPEKILAKAGGGTNLYAAAALIHKNFMADVPKKSDDIRVVFTHPDRDLVQPVLTQLIDAYRKKHIAVHMDTGITDESLEKETDQLKNRLADTEAELRKKKKEVEITSLDDARKSDTELASKIREEIFSTEAQLAETKATVQEIEKLIPEKSPSGTATNGQTAATNGAAIPQEKVDEYQLICKQLTDFQTKEQQLLGIYTPEVEQVKSTHQRVADLEKQKKALEAANPGLVDMKPSETKSGEPDRVATLRALLQDSKIKARTLEERTNALNTQLEIVRKHSGTVDTVEGTITELERDREQQETQYKYFSKTLEQSRIDEALGPGRVSNISTVQSPSPGYRDAKAMNKSAGGIFLGSVGGSIALAFLLEFFLDRSLKRPQEVEARLGVPFFLSIPRLKNSKARGLKEAKNVPLLPANGGNGNSDAPAEGALAPATNGHANGALNGEMAPWDERHELRPFYEALRDRLMLHFEMRNLTHKPKLVAVTGCAKGAGVTTTAAGLAACLSETGDGNVLLVDLNVQEGEAHHFYKGHLTGLDDVLDRSKRDNALVRENLYIAAETNSEKLPRILPKRFTHLVGKMKASDYDYIIFDMPVVSRISVTPRLARLMDAILLVVESEKTDRDVVKNATDLLSESKSNIGVVLTKGRSYVPKRLHQEL